MGEASPVKLPQERFMLAPKVIRLNHDWKCAYFTVPMTHHSESLLGKLSRLLRF